MSKPSTAKVYNFILENADLSDMGLAQELKIEFGITRIVDGLDIVKATRRSLKDVRKEREQDMQKL